MTTQTVAHKIEPVDFLLFSISILVLTIAFGSFVFLGGIFAFKALFAIKMTNAIYAMCASLFFLVAVILERSLKKIR